MDANEDNRSNSRNETIGEYRRLSNTNSINEFTMEAFKILVDAIKFANKLPFGKSRDLYESCPAFHTIFKRLEQRVLSNLSGIMKRTGSKGNIQKRDDEDKFEMIVDINDALVEKVSIFLDEISGVQKTPESNLTYKKLESLNESWNKDSNMRTHNSTYVINTIINKTKNMEKPQLKFQDKINNDDTIPFEPKIKYKYNLLKPLSILIGTNENGISEYSHPYEFELSKFKPPECQLMHKEPKLYKSLEETPLRIVERKEDIKALIQDLQNYKEISVDLEHHSYRSFQGFTCLLQISTRDTDYIVDTLLLRSELEELNQIFTDPSVVKIFHGADSDILWLQRDFSLYVVNMFDTHQAAKMLQYPNLSLAYLLKYYCNIIAQKHFQLADWRIRPLPQELMTYAREDTHYLLHIYDHLRNSLIDKANGQTNLLNSVIFESSQICLKTYQKPIFDKNGYLDIYHRSKKLFDNRQKSALQMLFEWRDRTARDLDESLAYVLPNHMMLNISEILPREAQGILACCNPVPPPVRQNLLNLHQIILKAREGSLVKPVLEEQEFHRHTSYFNFSDNPLYCPHDLNHEGDFRDDLPVLLFGENKNQYMSLETFNESEFGGRGKPIVDVFERSKTSQILDKTLSLNPYERYKLAKQYLESVDSHDIPMKHAKKECDEDTRESGEKGKEEIREPDFKKTEAPPVAGEEKSSEIVTEQGSAKRIRNEGPEVPSKKVKKETNSLTESFSDDSQFILNKSHASQQAKVKHKRREKMREKQFVPYNYESVNFDKYKTFTLPAKKKHKKICGKTRKRVTKNLKISV